MLVCGDTFLAGETEDDEPHLWVVITPPKDDEVITVSVTTQRRHSETLVKLKDGDHPFIRHDSVVAYAYSRIRTVEDIEAAITAGTAKRREPMSKEIVDRIRAGLLDSDFTPNGVRRYFKEF